MNYVCNTDISIVNNCTVQQHHAEKSKSICKRHDSYSNSHYEALVSENIQYSTQTKEKCKCNQKVPFMCKNSNVCEGKQYKNLRLVTMMTKMYGSGGQRWQLENKAFSSGLYSVDLILRTMKLIAALILLIFEFYSVFTVRSNRCTICP